MLDPAALLSGQLPTPGDEAAIVALALLTGERHRLARDQFAVLRSIPAGQWVAVSDRDVQTVYELIELGLVVVDGEEPPEASLRDRGEKLAASEWNLYAALYHFMTRWGGVELSDAEGEAFDLRESSRAAAREHLRRHGPPPSEFAPERGTPALKLPGADRGGELYRTLLARRTTRAYDPDAPMTLAQFDTVLRYVFGCHGYGANAAGVTVIKRTSPSGGALHPVDAYPIVSNVAGIDPGIYQYDSREHALRLLTELDTDVARQRATALMCGQRYFGSAHVSFVLAARFERAHWKYRRHQKAYAGILMDAAHLSQTLYLVAAELGLGAFVTIAVNARDADRELGLDGIGEGVIAVAGCGPRHPDGSPLEPEFAPGPPPR
jgi:putative peptide maturation dehydrogenase